MNTILKIILATVAIAILYFYWQIAWDVLVAVVGFVFFGLSWVWLLVALYLFFLLRQKQVHRH